MKIFIIKSNLSIISNVKVTSFCIPSSIHLEVITSVVLHNKASSDDVNVHIEDAKTDLIGCKVAYCNRSWEMLEHIKWVDN